MNQGTTNFFIIKYTFLTRVINAPAHNVHVVRNLLKAETRNIDGKLEQQFLIPSLA